MVRTGLDLVGDAWPADLRRARIGLLTHPASVTGNLVHAVDVFSRSGPWQLSALFGPQHGIRGETQDNMVEWRGFRDSRTGLPIYSLYGKHRRPTKRMLRGLDALVVDLQDVGARYYTFIWTLDLCLSAAREHGLSVVILDRPNPIGGTTVEGPVLDPAFCSFVGRRPLPVRHGMTLGEIARYLTEEFHPGADLRVVTLDGWDRRMYFPDTGLPWVLPSPNMPTVDTALVYPGLCLLEGTNLSEGRGTTRPFELFGAPFIEPDRLVERLRAFRLPGVRFRPAWFKPTFQKHRGRLCGGAQIHVRSRRRFKPFLTGVAILLAVRELYGSRLQWNPPPYEYETEKLPIDILAGNDRLRAAVDACCALSHIEEQWRDETRIFARTVRKRHLLY